ncbi:anti-sigma factor RsbA family regulatory protein [Nocardiopsis coralliicola]
MPAPYPPTGIPGDRTPRMRHQACLYGSDAEFLAAAVPFLRGGLADGVPVLAASTAANRVLLRTALGGDADRITLCDTADLGRRPPERLDFCDRFRRAAAAHGGARIIAEPVWAGRSERQVIAQTCLESSLTALFADAPLRLVCPYDVRRLPPPILAGALTTHPETIAGTSARPSESFVDPAVFARGDMAATPRTVPTGLFGGRFMPPDLPRVTEDAHTYALRAGAGAARADAVATAVQEAASNAVLHGAGHGSVWLWTEEDELVCEVGDASEGAPLPRFPGMPPAGGERPRGFWRIRLLCDRLHVFRTAGRTIVRMHTLVRD